MSWRLPSPLLVVALVPLAVVLRRPISGPRLVGEAFTITVAVIAAFWLAWGALWVIKGKVR